MAEANSVSYMAQATARPDRYLVGADQYSSYKQNGFLKVPGLIAADDIARLLAWTEDLMTGRVQVPGAEFQPSDKPNPDFLQKFTRVHMLHRLHETAEWGLLHPRVLDVLEALIGPDVTALQSMLFFNPPGRGGQGWHQDAYYIRTYPETLIGAWIALEEADVDNGCLWVAPGSSREPIYMAEGQDGWVHANGVFGDMQFAVNASNLDDELNSLSKVAARYPDVTPVPMKPGDVLFFESHLLHRSYPNRTEDRLRRAYVCHYCNARSWVPWNHGSPYEGDSANYLHILARGQTHLPYAKPAFGTPLDLPEPGSGIGKGGLPVMMASPDGNMEERQQPPGMTDDHD